MDVREARRFLGVPESASRDDVRRAYRRAVLKHHPDRNPDDPDAAWRLMLAKVAQDRLLGVVPAKRKRPLLERKVDCSVVGTDLVGRLPIACTRVGDWLSVELRALRPCAACEGEGQVRPATPWPWDAPVTCARCDGVGLLAVQRKLRLKVPTDREGCALRLRGRGVTGWDKPAGDAILWLV